MTPATSITIHYAPRLVAQVTAAKLCHGKRNLPGRMAVLCVISSTPAATPVAVAMFSLS